MNTSTRQPRILVEDTPAHCLNPNGLHLPVESLLSRLRYFAGSQRRGIAAWGADEASGRVSAWIKWDGKVVAAEFIESTPSGTERALSMQWAVSEGGEAFLENCKDRSGPIDALAVKKRFASIHPLDKPSFITLPPPPRTPRP